MAEKDIKVTLGKHRTDLLCNRCGDGMNASNTEFGTAMAAGFIKTHKCNAAEVKRRAAANPA